MAPRKKSIRTELVRALPLLHAASHMTDEERNSLLYFLNDAGKEVLYNCVYNCIYNKDIPKAKRREVRKQLGKQGSVYEYLAGPNNKPEKKNRLLTQHGAGLPTILSAVLPMLSTILAPTTVPSTVSKQ